MIENIDVSAVLTKFQLILNDFNFLKRVKEHHSKGKIHLNIKIRKQFKSYVLPRFAQSGLPGQSGISQPSPLQPFRQSHSCVAPLHSP